MSAVPSLNPSDASADRPSGAVAGAAPAPSHPPRVILSEQVTQPLRALNTAAAGDPQVPVQVQTKPAPVIAAASDESTQVKLMASVDIEKERITTVIGADMQFKGTFTGNDGVRIKGKVDGDIIIGDGTSPEHGTVVIERGGEVTGLVSGKRVIVLGQAGSVVSRTSLVVGNTGRILENTFYNKFVAAEGAEIEGNMRHLKNGMDPTKELLEKAAAAGT